MLYSARPNDALAAWRGILADVPDVANKPVLHVLTLNNLGRLCEMRKRLPEALDYLTRSLELDPDQPKVITHWVHLRQKLCVWPVYAALKGVTVAEQLAPPEGYAHRRMRNWLDKQAVWRLDSTRPHIQRSNACRKAAGAAGLRCLSRSADHQSKSSGILKSL